ncbi:MAG: hypothetical protein HYV08_07615, partial [Deltaproteobacteria bacterium]|nr:hypothetical protein [Deltaproteobacteria bacterium]
MTKVVIIGAGRGGRALLELFRDDPEVTILGVSDMDPRAPGIELARAMGVPVLTDFAELLRRTSEVDVVINVTGDPDVSKAVWDLKPDQAEVMGGLSAKFMWDLIEERKTKEAMADRMELMLRELDRHGEMIIGRNAKMKAIAELIAKVA